MVKIGLVNGEPIFQFSRCGPLIDLCRGPHVRHTGKIKSFSVTKVG